MFPFYTSNFCQCKFSQCMSFNFNFQHHTKMNDWHVLFELHTFYKYFFFKAAILCSCKFYIKIYLLLSVSINLYKYWEQDECNANWLFCKQCHPQEVTEERHKNLGVLFQMSSMENFLVQYSVLHVIGWVLLMCRSKEVS